MSMRTWTVEGFGIMEDVLYELTIEKKVRFIEKFLSEVYEEMKEDAIETPEGIEQWIDEYEDVSGWGGFTILFVNAINNNENDFHVEYECGEYENAIIYEDRAPWEMSERVKGMKFEDMKAIFANYLNELGITDFDFSRQSIEMYG